MLAFSAGLAAGLLHVFSGPDHLAAVPPLALGENGSREAGAVRVEGWRVGLQWGIGHTTGMLVIATLLLLLREQLPLDLISAYSDRLVGLALIALGSWGVFKAAHESSSPHTHTGTSFAMGTIHGLAGSSHIFGVLPALAFATGSESLLYLAGSGVGALAGMSAFAAGIGVLSARLTRSHRRANRLLYASSVAALVVGGVWLVGR